VQAKWSEDEQKGSNEKSHEDSRSQFPGGVFNYRIGFGEE
jgi:hypothetical protein